VTNLKTTDYFYRNLEEKHPEVLPYLHHVAQALTNYLAKEEDRQGRTRRYVHVPEIDRYLAVIAEADGETIHNAFFDRRFKRKIERGN